MSQSIALKPERHQPNWLRRLRRFLLWFFAILLVLTLILVGFASWFVMHTLPQTSGSIQINGLQKSTTVQRDQWGVPYISATTMHDLLFTQGYVTSQDRLFQMELSRHIAQGRIAEMFGAGPSNSLLQSDKILRALNFYAGAQAEWNGIDAEKKAELQAYADGVNAYISTHKNSLPLEFTFLGVTPAAWTPIDSLAYGRVIAFSLDNTWDTKYLRSRLLTTLGAQATDQILPPYPDTNPTFLSPKSTQPSVTTTLPATQSHVQQPLPDITETIQGMAIIQQLIGDTTEALGSNSWVVDGTKTTTGKPLLANDPHLAISEPGTWYEVELRTPHLHVVGFALPGIPWVIIGHNDHIAWGLTNVGADNADLYIETLDPQHHPGEYLYQGKWLSLQERKEVFRLRGSSTTQTLTIASTIHGPIISSLDAQLNNQQVIALKWTALQSDYQFSGFFQLPMATNWEQFVAAISNISISQNFMYADTAGNIGYHMSGLLPLRSMDNHLVPVDGSTDAHEWQGYVPQSEMPSAYDPPSHILVTANNRIVASNAPVYVTTTWDYGYRAKRISDLLTTEQQLSVADFQRIQADVYSIPAAQIAPFLVSAGQQAGGDAALAAHLLSGWDYKIASESVAASIYEVSAGLLVHKFLQPVLGNDLYTLYQGNTSSSARYTMLIDLLKDPVSPFVKGQTLEQSMGQRDQLIVSALTDAVRFLRQEFGDDTNQWTWGTLHQAHFQHPLATVWPLNYIFDVAPVARPGDNTTINVGGSGGFSALTPEYGQHSVSSMREIVDLSDLDRSLWMLPVGQSGQPYSAHYNDLLPLWQDGRYQSMPFSPRAIATATLDTLQCNP
jgi:penicillin amidase